MPNVCRCHLSSHRLWTTREASWFLPSFLSPVRWWTILSLQMLALTRCHFMWHDHQLWLQACCWMWAVRAAEHLMISVFHSPLSLTPEIVGDLQSNHNFIDFCCSCCAAEMVFPNLKKIYIMLFLTESVKSLCNFASDSHFLQRVLTSQT